MAAHVRFGAWVEEQLAAGRTRTDLAHQLGCHPSLITRIVDGSRANPTLRIVHAIETATANWVRGQIRTEDWLVSDAAPSSPPREAA